MRLDKFLKVSRILKRRTVANEACTGGKVSVNGRTAKPGAQLKTGDTVSISFAGFDLTFVVKELRESVRKEDAAKMYEIIGETEK
ncbi:MAG: RNA-binding S4 domain-containing protein [Clostridia bacterium]|nr:RNA-binding S4 domain-containing protein [Clostridia bacterium]